MIGFTLTNLSFDGTKILEKVRKAEERALRIIGFQTRETAQKLIVDGTGRSHPGNPPLSKVGTLRRFILYQIDKQAESVVVGPKYLKRKSKDAPAALEHGGISLNAKQRPIRVAKRPFMGPAFNTVKRQQVPAVFGNSLK